MAVELKHLCKLKKGKKLVTAALKRSSGNCNPGIMAAIVKVYCTKQKRNQMGMLVYSINAKPISFIVFKGDAKLHLKNQSQTHHISLRNFVNQPLIKLLIQYCIWECFHDLLLNFPDYTVSSEE
ncbi:hypothetical protein E2C01_018044 [Portunus trituberculatus]|uniref:Uncharacterized protein n=1 Tax=Portunus trituberculatus TaxID=210409 RepID=A0A5B7DU20_PORTR|nr:hypothetical protein [Portunus trituberculatus]